MDQSDRVRLWLADKRSARGGTRLILTYATPDGSRRLSSTQSIPEHDDSDEDSDHPVAAAIDADITAVEFVDNQDERVELAAAARETQDRYDPDEQIRLAHE